MTMNEVTGWPDSKTNIFRSIHHWSTGGCLLFATIGVVFFGCESVVVLPDPELACRDLIVKPCSSAEPAAEIVAACKDLYAGRLAFVQRCPNPSKHYPAEEAQVFVDTCVGIATSRGVTLTPMDIRACGEQVKGWPCSRGETYTCLGLSGDLLYPQHDKTGSLELGESCFAQVQCASGYCDCGRKWCNTCGTCKRGRAEGESCTEATDVCIERLGCSDGICQQPGKKLGEQCGGKGVLCQPALYCNESGPMYTDFKCAAYGQGGASCDSHTRCASEFFCQGGTCVLRLPDGTNCTDDSACASFWCNGGVCTAKPSPPTPPTGLSEGQDCSVGSCQEDLWCNKDDICVVRTYLAEGAVCAKEDFPAITCENGFYCDDTCTPDNGCHGTCRSLPPAGEPCTQYAACARGAYCTEFGPDLTKSLCVKLGTTGEACPCAHGLTCLSGKCVMYGMCE
jgi:hypothetical protein